jgi:hypothetical protein
MLKLLAHERTIAQQKQEQTDLVWTGPEVLGAESRDTAIVVRELFKSARHSVLLSSFAIDQGSKGHELFRPLVDQMAANPELSVRMFLNVKRHYNDRTPASTLLRQFQKISADTFGLDNGCQKFFMTQGHSNYLPIAMLACTLNVSSSMRSASSLPQPISQKRLINATLKQASSFLIE